MVDIALQLSPEFARGANKAESIRLDQFKEAVERSGGSMGAPMVFGDASPCFVTITSVPDESAEELRQELAAMEGVEGAYIKPPDALP